MIAFVFRPICDFLKPFESCSNGWLLYYILSALVVIAFRSPVVSIVEVCLFALFYAFFGFGIPSAELIAHWVLGALIGYLITKKHHTKVPPFVKDGIIHNLSGFLQISMVLALEVLLFFAVDEEVLENQRPYGLVATFMLLAVWLFAAAFFLYCTLAIERYPFEQQLQYWHLWFDISLVLFIAMLFGFVPGINSYLKATMASCVSAVVLTASQFRQAKK